MSFAAGWSVDVQRVVIKLGSSLVLDVHTRALNMPFLYAISRDVSDLLNQDIQCVIVSSGAVGLGRPRLGLTASGLTLNQRQAAAAAGQTVLVQGWERAFEPHGVPVAQALLTYGDIERRRSWLNARSTLRELVGCGAVPVINENDTVSTEELRFGDNDRLAARVAQMISADLLILLSDVPGVCTADPRHDPNATLIEDIAEITPQIEALAGGAGASGVGTGGMATKIAAARIAGSAGCTTLIASGRVDHPVMGAAQRGGGSCIRPSKEAGSSRQAWIAGALEPVGRLVLDSGAVKAVLSGKSLLPVGLKAATGSFSRGDVVRLDDEAGQVIGKGVVGYDVDEVRRIAGLKTDSVEAELGYRRGSAVVHCEDLVLAAAAKPG